MEVVGTVDGTEGVVSGIGVSSVADGAGCVAPSGSAELASGAGTSSVREVSCDGGFGTSSPCDLKYSSICDIASCRGVSDILKLSRSRALPLLKPNCPNVFCKSVKVDNSLPIILMTGCW